MPTRPIQSQNACAPGPGSESVTRTRHLALAFSRGVPFALRTGCAFFLYARAGGAFPRSFPLPLGFTVTCMHRAATRGSPALPRYGLECVLDAFKGTGGLRPRAEALCRVRKVARLGLADRRAVRCDAGFS